MRCTLEVSFPACYSQAHVEQFPFSATFVMKQDPDFFKKYSVH
jgi:hypothetical protein